MARRWAQELPDLDVGPFLIAGTLQRLALHVDRGFGAISRSYGMGTGDLRILLALRRSGPSYALSPTTLFRQLLVTSGAVSKQVDRLVDLGMVERVADPGQLRGVLIRLLPRGREVADDAMRRISTSFCSLESLSEEDITSALAALNTLRRVMERDSPEPPE
jgi:DNA-binding MarR family transcriptional regulator